MESLTLILGIYSVTEMPMFYCALHSITGHRPPTHIGLQMYTASKHAVTALAEGLRLELVKLNSKIRVTVSVIQRVFSMIYNLYSRYGLQLSFKKIDESN